MTVSAGETRSASRAARAIASEPRGFDLLRVPGVGRLLRWRHARLALQLPMLAIAGVMIVHALLGPQLAPKNLGVLLTWVHFRGLVVLVILLAGNVFCMACPFMLPRELARRLRMPTWSWPRRLRNKWPAIVLFVAVLFVYELFDLWGEPWWTGMLIVGYFGAALVVDVLFRNASFCKYVCPVGQFNFLSSTMSPLEVTVRDHAVCADCTTRDCIRGRHAGAPDHASPAADGIALPVIQRGCELHLFLPRKKGNLDCTFCLDCIHACPHENIGITARPPGSQLAEHGPRSGLGRLENRFDFTALALVFTFGALLNAFAMTSPVYALEHWVAGWTGLTVEWPILGALFVVALVLEPALLLTAAALWTRAAAHLTEPLLAVVNRFARSLVPIGFGIWLAHYGFHFFTGMLTIVPVTQNAVLDACGVAWLGEPMWQLGGLPVAIVDPLEILLMVFGLVGSCLVAWRIACQTAPQRAAHAFAPWACLHVALFLAGCWIMAQPMDMRGTLIGS